MSTPNRLTTARKYARKPLSLVRKVSSKLADAVYTAPPPPRPIQEIRTKTWFEIEGDKTRRLDYPLTAKSVVFDLGGYEGQWASDIVARFNCRVYVFEPMPAYADNISRRFGANPKVSVHPFGLSNQQTTIKLSVDEASSSAYKSSASDVTGELRPAAQFIAAEGLEQIDLMKINIEGGEYDLLEHLIATGDINKVIDLQVQFHDFVPQAETRMHQIQQNLSKTHFLTYQYPFVWDNWRRKDRLAETIKLPLVSVIMAAYNSEEFLRPAIDSILGQTMPGFELIIVDDGSTDHTAKIIASYNDPRIVCITQKNQGLAAALNHGAAKARGAYIARMDADDISLPYRLQLQTDYLGTHPQVGLLGGSYEIVKASDLELIDNFTGLTEPDDLFNDCFVHNPFGHGTVMIRRTVFDAVGGYDETQTVEDYELWWRIAQTHLTANVPEVIYQWRHVVTSMSHAKSAERQAPITNLMNAIWEAAKPTPTSYRQMKQRLAHYRALTPPSQPPVFADQYIYSQFAIGLAELCKGRRVAGTQRLRAAVTLAPHHLPVLLTMFYGNRSTKGYSLQLLLPQPAYANRVVRRLLRGILPL